MDYIRSCYRGVMYSFDPASGDMVPFSVRWYRPPLGALPIGIHHQYGSGIWDLSPTGVGEVGEIPGVSRLYDKGATPEGLTGTEFCGDAKLWRGKLLRLDTPLSSNPAGQPICCPFVMRSHVVMRASSGWTLTEATPCVSCGTDPTPLIWRVFAAGFGSPHSDYNGVWTLHQASPSSPCNWNTLPAGPPVFLSKSGSGISVDFGLIPEAAVYVHDTPPPDCVHCWQCFKPPGGPAWAPSSVWVCPGDLVPPQEYSGSAGVLLSPSSSWSPAIAGYGSAALVLSPSSSWSTPYAYDCSACPDGLQLHTAFDGSAFVGVFSDLNPSFQADYGGSCYFVGNTGACAWNYAVNDASGFVEAILSVSNSATGDTCQYRSAPFDPLGSNTWSLSSDSTGGDAPSSITSSPI